MILLTVVVTAAVLLCSVWAISTMLSATVTQTVNGILNSAPPSEIEEQAETAIQVDLLGEGRLEEKGEDDFLPPWEREFEGTDW